MPTKRLLLAILLASAVVLATGIGLGRAGVAQGLPLPVKADQERVTVPYAAALSGPSGQPVADGAYDLSFALYAAETGGELLWSEVQAGVTVEAGLFEVALGSATMIPAELLDGGERWLEVGVRGPAEAGFTQLLPRQRLSNALPAVPESPTAGAACPHDHVGEVWAANVPWSNGALKVLNYQNGPSIWGWNGGNGNGVRGYATGNGLGVYGESQDSAGVVGRSAGGRGVEGHSINSNGVFAHSDNNHSLYVDGAGKNGVHVGSAGDHGVYVASAGWSGVSVWSASVAGLWVHSAGQDGILVDTAGWDGVHVVGPVGGTYFGSGAKGAEDFAVLNTGEVRSKVGFAAPGNAFAITLAVEGSEAAYEPGDVLAASALGSGAAVRTSATYSPAVVGVISEAPAFVGGRPVTDGDAPAGVSVAIMGVVDCKVSAENGPILPGDLLVTSATPGHAMRAGREEALPGTILGKALESLDSGTGLIQVLVTLQ